MGLRERKKDQTRRQLLEAALELIRRQGFEETTINQIAAAVNISSRTVLRYFPTKEDVIVSWVEDGMAIFLNCLKERPLDEAAHLSLLASAREMLMSYQERAEFYLTIERVIASSSVVSARKYEMSAALGEKVSQVLSLRPEISSLACELYTALAFSMLRVVIRAWVAMAGQRHLVDLFDETVAMIEFNTLGNGP